MNGKRNNTHGFTMIETLVAVAIVVIALGIVFVGVINYQRSMKRVELDATAKEIFVAAQNHLTMASSQGVLGARTGDVALGESHKSKDDEGHRYFFVQPGDPRLVRPQDNPTPTVLYDMLPRFSIDETVRLGGSYVIEYDYATATVLNVFYSDQSNLSKVTFKGEESGVGSDYNELFVDPCYVGSETENAEAAKLRLVGFKGESNKIIGWYGGEEAKSLKRAKLYAPRVEIINEECLEVRVSFTTTALNKMIDSVGSDAVLKLEINGKKSRHSQAITLDGAGRTELTLNAFAVSSQTGSYVDGNAMRRYQSYILDDITQEGKHFKDLWCKDGDSNALIAGENIVVTATLNTTADSNSLEIVTAVSGEENSLFGEMKLDDNLGASTQKRVASISNIRHLENLDGSISGYDLDALGEDGAIKAVQTRDLSWEGDGKNTSTAFLDRIYANKTRIRTESGPSDVRVYRLDKTSTKPGTYAPVTPQYSRTSEQTAYALNYNGDKLSITGVKIDIDGGDNHAGLFAELKANCSVSNLKLIDFDVIANDGRAGALAGSLQNATVENVVAYESKTKPFRSVQGAIAGGLVGSVSGGTITKSAAAVYVRGTGNPNGNVNMPYAGSTGGIIGLASNAAISYSYAGGHTKDGSYVDTDDANQSVRINVLSQSGAAGGLIGTAINGTDVSYSYSTCSASGGTDGGGLIGTAVARNIDGASGSACAVNTCYATGLVSGNNSVNMGAFIGRSENTTMTENLYFEIINQNMQSVGNANGATIAEANVMAFDKDVATMQLMYGQSNDKVEPYDDTLKKYYNGVYPLKLVNQLKKLGDNPVVSADFVTTHYGDWPAPETLVVNVPNT